MKPCTYAMSLALLLATGCGRPVGTLNFAEVGNGGHGVVAEGKVYLVDLVEAGVETKPKVENHEFPKKNNFEGLLREGVRTNVQFDDKSIFPYAAVAERLGTLYRSHPVLAMALLETMRMYQWNFIERDLKKLPLRGTVTSFDEGSIMLVANRLGRSIYVNALALLRMDNRNRAALVFHEAIYALIRPTRVEGKLTQNAARVREVTSYLFSRDDYGSAFHNGSVADLTRMEELLGEDFSNFADRRFSRGLSVEATFASHFAPTPSSSRVLVARPKLFIEGPDVPEVGKLSLEFQSPRHIDENRDALTKWFDAAPFRAKEQITLRLVPGDDERKGAFTFRFAEYEEAGELKTYVKADEVKEPYEVKSVAMEMPASAQDVELRAWVALMRVEMGMQFGGILGRAHVYDRAVELATKEDILLPRDRFMHLLFAPKRK